MLNNLVSCPLNGPIKRGLFACSVLVALVACQKPDGVNESRLGYQLSAGETHFQFTFAGVPASGTFKGKPSSTFRIPREYVWFENILSRWDGSMWRVSQVPVEIEFPSMKPRQKWPVPWRGTRAAEEQGKYPPPDWFLVELGSGSGLGGRGYFLSSISSKNPQRSTDMVADGEAYGLVRYSPKRCYTVEQRRDPQLKVFLDAKPADDPTPEAHCRLSRRSAVYFSPLSITAPEEVVFINCTPTGCFVNFTFDGMQGANFHFRNEYLARWPEIVDPIRRLLRSFIVLNSTGNASPPSSATASSR